MSKPHIEYLLLALLALCWGSSYLFIKIAVAEIPPLTLVAARVTGAALLLISVMYIRRERLPTDRGTWGSLGVQSVFNSIGAWTLLAWGQQSIDAGVASVLNSTAPVFVFLFTVLITRHESTVPRRLLGAILGVCGVALIVGLDLKSGFRGQVLGQIACLAGAVLYACAAIYGRRFASVGALATATGTMIWASAVLVPVALIVDRPWLLSPSVEAMLATLVLSVICTGLALLLYFRLLNTLGSMGVASQAYLRASVGVVLGILFLGETMTFQVGIGLAAAIVGVAMINWPIQPSQRTTSTKSS